MRGRMSRFVLEAGAEGAVSSRFPTRSPGAEAQVSASSRFLMSSQAAGQAERGPGPSPKPRKLRVVVAEAQALASSRPEMHWLAAELAERAPATMRNSKSRPEPAAESTAQTPNRSPTQSLKARLGPQTPASIRSPSCSRRPRELPAARLSPCRSLRRKPLRRSTLHHNCCNLPWGSPLGGFEKDAGKFS